MLFLCISFLSLPLITFFPPLFLLFSFFLLSLSFFFFLTCAVYLLELWFHFLFPHYGYDAICTPSQNSAERHKKKSKSNQVLLGKAAHPENTVLESSAIHPRLTDTGTWVINETLLPPAFFPQASLKKKRKWPLTLGCMNKSSTHGTKHENSRHRLPHWL